MMIFPRFSVRKSFEDTREAQLENGLIPDIAQEYVVFEKGFENRLNGKRLHHYSVVPLSLVRKRFAGIGQPL